MGNPFWFSCCLFNMQTTSALTRVTNYTLHHSLLHQTSVFRFFFHSHKIIAVANIIPIEHILWAFFGSLTFFDFLTFVSRWTISYLLIQFSSFIIWLLFLVQLPLPPIPSFHFRYILSISFTLFLIGFLCVISLVVITTRCKRYSPIKITSNIVTRTNVIQPVHLI